MSFSGTKGCSGAIFSRLFPDKPGKHRCTGSLLVDDLLGRPVSLVSKDSTRFVPLGEERGLLGSRCPAEDRIAVRKAAESRDDLDIGAAVTAQRTATIALARQAVEQ